MLHKPVNSSAISAIGFDPTTNDMEVLFHNGSIAKHSTTKAQYEALISADSIGKHYSQSFKGKKQEFVKQNHEMKR